MLVLGRFGPGARATIAGMGRRIFDRRLPSLDGAIRRARTMDIPTFQQRVVEAYQTVLEEMMLAAPSHMVRFWAFLPGIHDDLGVGLDRAFRRPPFLRRPFRSSVPTASASEGDEFSCMASLQRSPEFRSRIPVRSGLSLLRRFGPIRPVSPRPPPRRTSNPPPVEEDTPPTSDALLSKFRNCGSITRAPHDAAAIAALVQTYFPSSCRIELAQASLCRPELLIEIEGLATLRPRVSRPPSPLTLES